MPGPLWGAPAGMGPFDPLGRRYFGAGQGIKDGRTAEVMNRKNLYRLYGTPVDILGLPGVSKTCVSLALFDPFHLCLFDKSIIFP